MKKLCNTFVSILVICGFVIIAQETEVIRIAPNDLIEQMGLYCSPSGNCYVQISQEKAEELKFFVYRQIPEGRDGSGPAKPFGSKSKWFMCWDSQDRLWAYMPDNEVRYYYANAEATGSCRVGEFGGWDGIPEQFLEKLPTKIKAMYEAYINKKKKTDPNQ